MEYTLPSYIPYFQQTLDGIKRHEIRKEDPAAPFHVGDTILLWEFDLEKQAYTGRTKAVEITWVSPRASGLLPAGKDGKVAGYAYLSIKPVKNSWWKFGGLFGSVLFGRGR